MKGKQTWKVLLIFTFVFFTITQFSTTSFAIGDIDHPVTITENEPNDTMDTAQIIDPFSEGWADLADTTDQDFYRFTMPAKGTYYSYAVLNNDGSEEYAQDFNIVVYDEAGQRVGQSSYVEYTDSDTNEVIHGQQFNLSLEKGQYYFSVQATNKDSYFESLQYYLINWAEFDKPNFQIDSITTNVKSPQLLGKTITLSANSQTAGLEYKFTINGAVVQDFGLSNKYVWKPNKPGIANITVDARIPDSPYFIVSKQLTYEIKDGNVTISGLTANHASPSPINTSIRWTANAQGVDLQYKFSVLVNKKWSVVQNFSSKNYFDWKPKTTGSYQVRVDVKSKASGKTAYKLSSGYSIFKPGNFSITSLTPNLKSPRFSNTGIIFVPKASGSYLEYRYRIFDGYAWYTARDFSSIPSFWWKTPYSGNYQIAVDVRVRGTSTIKTKIISYSIKETPNFDMNSNYDIYANSAFLRVQNKGYKNLIVQKIEFVNNGKVIFTHIAQNFITIGQDTQTFYFTPKKTVTQYNYDTTIKVYYNYDGISSIAYLNY